MTGLYVLILVLQAIIVMPVTGLYFGLREHLDWHRHHDQYDIGYWTERPQR